MDLDADLELPTLEQPKEKKDDKKFDRIADEIFYDMLKKKEFPLYFQGRFYQYRGCRYEEEKELGGIVRRWLKTHDKGQSNNIVGNVVPIIESRAYHRANDYPNGMPFYKSKEQFPDPHNIIAFRNGLLDVTAFLQGKTELIPHTPKWVSTFCLPHDFQPDALCPQWLHFLGQVFEGDTQKIDLLQEWFGYCLTADTSQQKFLVKVGVPRSGKGTSDRIQKALLGDENYTGFDLHSLADKFGKRRLVDKRVAFVPEVNLAGSKEKHRILETLNAIVGEDTIDIEEKFNPVSLSQRLNTRFCISCNQLPPFVDPSGASSARLLVLDYPVSFEGRIDIDLSNKLLSEISGIMNWALQGLVQLKQKGKFTIPESTKIIKNEFRRNTGTAFAFMQDCLCVARHLNPGNLTDTDVKLWDDPNVSVKSSVLAAKYDEWCNENHKDNQYFSTMVKDLKTILPKLEAKREVVETGKKETVYYGIFPRGE